MIYTHAAAALVALAVGFGGGWKVEAWRRDSADLKREQAEQRELLRRMDRADGAAVRHEATRASLQVQRQALTQETDRAIAAAPDWHAAECFDADGLRGIAAALGSPGDSSEPAPALPSSAASR